MSHKYDPVAKTLHWFIALILLVMLTLGWTIGDLPLEEKIDTLKIHSGLGITVLVLMLARLAWRRGHPPPPLPDTMPRWQAIASKANHHSLYLFAILQPILGIGQGLFAKISIMPFGIASLSIGADKTLFKIFHELHELNAFLLIGLISLHVLAALYNHFWLHNTVLKRMLPFVRV